jgi:hypothetical protein
LQALTGIPDVLSSSRIVRAYRREAQRSCHQGISQGCSKTRRCLPGTATGGVSKHMRHPATNSI